MLTLIEYCFFSFLDNIHYFNENIELLDELYDDIKVKLIWFLQGMQTISRETSLLDIKPN